MPPKPKKAVTAPAAPSRPLPTTKSSQPVPKAADVAKSNDHNSRQAPSTPHSASPSPLPQLEPAESASLNIDPDNAPSVNRKKQKRREKEAAKRAAEQNLNHGFPTSDHQAQNGHASSPHQGRGPPKGYFTEEHDYIDPDFADEAVEVDDAFYSGPEDPAYSQDPMLQNGYQHSGHPGNPTINGKKKKKTGKGSNYSDVAQNDATVSSASLTRPPAPLSRPHPPQPLSNAALRASHKISDRIWSTSTSAERENIKQFWLELGEDERRSLVKVEKEAVLRKMKEQQKHSCSCTVCGRKRTAIEEELEVLYDAYYEELEQFANHNHGLPNGPPIMPPPRTYNHVRSPPPMAGSYPTRGRVQEIGDEDEDLDEEEEYDEDDEPFSDDDVEELPRPPPDFFTFGNSLTVKDGILTVADDLLKNDGKHFIDMMEQLAERRMQREEETHYPSATLAHQNFHQGHNHPPLDEDDDYDDDDEDDEDYDSQDEEDYEGDEMDAMTEEQRMEEGRRMFQIFAARMFEQRVLTAYREKVAQERQRKFLEELDEENRLDTQREAKKAKEAAKKKEKKKLQKQAKEEEKAKKDAEKAAQEAAAREIEERKLEEQRQRKEEQRKKREAEKKASEEERARKEADKLRKVQEERERQAELERKQREAKEREKKKREEGRKKEREEREAKEREAKERKLKEEKERRVKDEQAKKEREAAEKAERDMRDRARLEQATRRPPVAVPPGLHPHTHPTTLQSPHFQVATPIIPPKVPTPAARQRQASQQGQQSRGSSPRSLQANTETSHSSVSPVTVAIPQTPVQASVPARAQGQPPVLHHPQPSAPLSPLNNQGRTGHPQYGYNGMPGLGMNAPPTSGPGMMPGMMPSMPIYPGPPMGGQHRNFGPPNGIPYPPGIHSLRQFPPNPQQMPFHSQPPMQAPILAPQAPAPKAQTHSRHSSGAPGDSNPQPAPISRPAPIARPSSTTPDKQKRKSTDPDVDKLATQLGSKALLDDSDIPLGAKSEPMNISGPGAPGSGRAPFGSFPDSKPESFNFPSQNWIAFSSNTVGQANWGAPGPTNKQGGGWPAPSQSSNNAFGIIGGGMHGMSRSHAPRPVAVRRMLAEACKQLSAAHGSAPDGFHPVQNVLRQIAPKEPTITLDDMLEICDTEGNAQNGGGSFEIRIDSQRGQLVKFEADNGNVWPGKVGDIGSPIVGHSQTAAFGHAFGAPGKGF